MMQHGQWNSNQMQGLCGQCNRMHGSVVVIRCDQCNQMQPIVCPTQYRCHDTFVPREVPVIHPIVNVNRQHNVVVPRNYVTETTRNVPGSTVFPRGGQQFGGPALEAWIWRPWIWRSWIWRPWIWRPWIRRSWIWRPWIRTMDLADG